MKTLFATLATVLVLASPARADGVLDQILTPFDKARLANFDQSSAAALKEARAGGDPADVREDELFIRRIVSWSAVVLHDGRVAGVRTGSLLAGAAPCPRAAPDGAAHCKEERERGSQRARPIVTSTFLRLMRNVTSFFERSLMPRKKSIMVRTGRPLISVMTSPGRNPAMADGVFSSGM